MSLYRPPHFAVDDLDTTVALVRRAAVGHIVSTHDGQLFSSFVPVLIDDSATVVRAHLARANPHARQLLADGATSALIIVTGAEGYVSPTAYATKQSDPRVVPTWNYELAHLHGTLRTIDDDGALDTIVRSLTDQHEASNAEPWSVDDAPADYLQSMRRAIVAVELQVERIEAKRKLSQNRPVDDIVGVIADLTRRGDRALAEAMTDANEL